MNIHTYFVMKLREKTDLKKHHASILKKLDGILSTIDGLREDPEDILDKLTEKPFVLVFVKTLWFEKCCDVNFTCAALLTLDSH